MAEWEFEHSVETSVSPQAAWDFWADVSNWTLDSTLEWVTLDGPFAAGAKGITKPRGAEPTEWLIRRVAPPAGATIEMSLAGAVVTFEWIFSPGISGGTRMTQRASLSGPQAAEYVDVAESQLAAGIPAGMRKLAEAMERSRG